MQFRVADACSSANCGTGINRTPSNTHPVDDVDATHLASLFPAVQTAFKNSQEPIIVPQAAHNAAYGTTVSDAAGGNLSRISDTSLSYKPLELDANGQPTGAVVATTQTLIMQPKSIIEDFTIDYGRMNAMLGVEVPKTTAINQTSIPQGYIDPATELVKISKDATPISGTAADGTQIWKITHNGVDTHPVHFHLFHVQLINRVGWDGAITNPQESELGWKDTVRMNPLEDIIVALRPRTMNLPFKLGNHHRTQDPSNADNASPNTAMSFNLDPTTGNASDVLNNSSNYGWEYVWHCHILGHEENDFMRAIAVAAQPEVPLASNATGASTSVTVNWTDNSVVSNWVEIQRATNAAFTQNVTTFNVIEPECASQSGCPRSYVDTTVPANTSVYYRVRANNTVGSGMGKQEGGYDPNTGDYLQYLPAELAPLMPVNDGSVVAGSRGFAGYGSATANSDWSNTVSRLLVPVASLSTSPVTTPVSVAFGNQNINTTSAAKTVTLSNTGAGVLNISNIATSASFARSGGTCAVAFPATLNPGTSCTIGVTFSPTAVQPYTGTLTVTDNSNNVANSTQAASLSGTGVAAAVNPVAPTTVIDNFNRANANTLGANWQQNVALGAAVLRVNTNQATANLLGATGSAYSNTVGGATQGAGFNFASAPANNTALYLKATGGIGAISGQLQNAVRVLYNTAGNVTISTTTNGNALLPTYTNAVAAISTSGALVNGNSLLAAVDNTGKVWVWKVVGATTTLLTPVGVQLPNNALWTTGGGKVGMQLPNGARIDNFVAY
jgi:hypothetical protein